MISKESISAIKESLRTTQFHVQQMDYQSKYLLPPEAAIKQKDEALSALKLAMREITQYEKENWK